MSSKFWRSNEKKLMRSLGLAPVFGSGNTWIAKEDGESEFVLAQAKSTEGESISIKKKDVVALYQNALTLDKMPVFVLDFVSDRLPLKLVAFDFDDAQKLLGIMKLVNNIKEKEGKEDES